LLRDQEFSKFYPVFSQAKFKKLIGSQPAALHTMIPEELYHKNRGKKGCSDALRKKQWETWNSVREQLFDIETQNSKKKRKREVVRFMVQYGKSTNAATPGPVGFGQVSAWKKQKTSVHGHDHLVTVDGRNGACLFGPNGKDFLGLIKER
jgi:hypothetical protein